MKQLLTPRCFRHRSGCYIWHVFLETEADDYQKPNPTATVMRNGDDCRYEIPQNAYIKLVLHALVHKTSTVNGVLLGRLSGDVVEITESVPLFHSSQIGLLPPLEISLIIVFSLILILGFVFVFISS